MIGSSDGGFHRRRGNAPEVFDGTTWLWFKGRRNGLAWVREGFDRQGLACDESHDGVEDKLDGWLELAQLIVPMT